MKECFKCKISKPISDFYKHSKMADGHLGKCKECNPMKRKAQNAANNALRDGRLQREYFCEVCGRGGKLHKHHWSYAEENWLDVTWLCSKCHGREHARLNELGRDPDR